MPTTKNKKRDTSPDRGDKSIASKCSEGEGEEENEGSQSMRELRSPSYGSGSSHQPAELFRKDLISAMKVADSEQLQPDNCVFIADSWRMEWEKGVQVPVNPAKIHEVNIRKITNAPCSRDFKIPKKLLHAVKDVTYKQGIHELTGMQLLAEDVVRYDLDDMDVTWLTLLNEDRVENGAIAIYEWTVEKLIEEFENISHEKMETQIKTQEGLGIEYDEDIICDICRSPDSEDTNEMVFCDGCDICVHQACYGIQSIPDGNWLCRACATGVKPTCILCSSTVGAMKPTRSGTKWAHVSCALWIPEVSIGCVEKMEPVTKISQIPSSRWSLLCYLCKDRVGACIQCSIKTCKTAFHVTCAFKNNLEMKAAMEDDESDIKLKAHCEKHSRKGDMNDSIDDIDCNIQGKDSTLSPRKMLTHEEKENLRAERLLEINETFYTNVEPSSVAERLQFPDDIVEAVYHYWKLKRKSLSNKPLLTAKQEEADMLEKQQEDSLLARMKMFVQLRQDLERVRNLCYMVSRREKAKREYYRVKDHMFRSMAKVIDAEKLQSSVRELAKVARLYHIESLYDHTTMPARQCSGAGGKGGEGGKNEPTMNETLLVCGQPAPIQRKNSHDNNAAKCKAVAGGKAVPNKAVSGKTVSSKSRESQEVIVRGDTIGSTRKSVDIKSLDSRLKEFGERISGRKSTSRYRRRIFDDNADDDFVDPPISVKSGGSGGVKTAVTPNSAIVGDGESSETGLNARKNYKKFGKNFAGRGNISSDVVKMDASQVDDLPRPEVENRNRTSSMKDSPSEVGSVQCDKRRRITSIFDVFNDVGVAFGDEDGKKGESGEEKSLGNDNSSDIEVCDVKDIVKSSLEMDESSEAGGIAEDEIHPDVKGATELRSKRRNRSMVGLSSKAVEVKVEIDDDDESTNLTRDADVTHTSEDEDRTALNKPRRSKSSVRYNKCGLVRDRGEQRTDEKDIVDVETLLDDCVSLEASPEPKQTRLSTVGAKTQTANVKSEPSVEHATSPRKCEEYSDETGSDDAGKDILKNKKGKKQQLNSKMSSDFIKQSETHEYFSDAQTQNADSKIGQTDAGDMNDSDDDFAPNTRLKKPWYEIKSCRVSKNKEKAENCVDERPKSNDKINKSESKERPKSNDKINKSESKEVNRKDGTHCKKGLKARSPPIEQSSYASKTDDISTADITEDDDEFVDVVHDQSNVDKVSTGDPSLKKPRLNAKSSPETTEIDCDIKVEATYEFVANENSRCGLNGKILRDEPPKIKKQKLVAAEKSRIVEKLHQDEKTKHTDVHINKRKNSAAEVDEKSNEIVHERRKDRLKNRNVEELDSQVEKMTEDGVGSEKNQKYIERTRSGSHSSHRRGFKQSKSSHSYFRKHKRPVNSRPSKHAKPSLKLTLPKSKIVDYQPRADKSPEHRKDKKRKRNSVKVDTKAERDLTSIYESIADLNDLKMKIVLSPRKTQDEIDSPSDKSRSRKRSSAVNRDDPDKHKTALKHSAQSDSSKPPPMTDARDEIDAGVKSREGNLKLLIKRKSGDVTSDCSHSVRLKYESPSLTPNSDTRVGPEKSPMKNAISGDKKIVQDRSPIKNITQRGSDRTPIKNNVHSDCRIGKSGEVNAKKQRLQSCDTGANMSNDSPNKRPSFGDRLRHRSYTEKTPVKISAVDTPLYEKLSPVLGEALKNSELKVDRKVLERIESHFVESPPVSKYFFNGCHRSQKGADVHLSKNGNGLHCLNHRTQLPGEYASNHVKEKLTKEAPAKNDTVRSVVYNARGRLEGYRIPKRGAAGSGKSPGIRKCRKNDEFKITNEKRTRKGKVFNEDSLSSISSSSISSDDDNRGENYASGDERENIAGVNTSKLLSVSSPIMPEGDPEYVNLTR